MALWRLYYHLIWTTKNRYPFIKLDKEVQLYPYIVSKADSLGSIVHAIGGIEDHIHLAVSIPPKLSISEFTKNIKGSSSYYYNNTFPDSHKFSWQEGYGVFSLGNQQLEKAVNYVNHQKEHHQKKTLINSLEIIDAQDDSPSRQYSLYLSPVNKPEVNGM